MLQLMLHKLMLLLVHKSAQKDSIKSKTESLLYLELEDFPLENLKIHDKVKKDASDIVVDSLLDGEIGNVT